MLEKFFVFLLSCGVVAAAEERAEEEVSFSQVPPCHVSERFADVLQKASVVKTEMSQAEIEACSGSQEDFDKVWLGDCGARVVCVTGGKGYSMKYHVDGSMKFDLNPSGSKTLEMLAEDFFEEHFLFGYCWKEGFPTEPIDGANLHLRDVDVSQCHRCRFGSLGLEAFLGICAQYFGEEGVPCDSWPVLSSDILKFVQNRSCFLAWTIFEKEDFAYELLARDPEAETNAIFILIKGLGILGATDVCPVVYVRAGLGWIFRMTRFWPEDGSDANSPTLLQYKKRQAKIL